jgi:hypothetical protein
MKKQRIFFFVLGIFFASCNLSAQHTIALGAGGGVSRLTGDLGKEGSFGLNYYLEGKYYLTPKLTAGLEYNSAAVGYGNDDSAFGVSFYGNTTVFAKGEYFLTTKKVRPYAAVGIGFSSLETPELSFTDANGNEATIESEKKGNLGISPRLGIMLGKFGIEFSYNIAGKTPESTVFNVSSSDKAFNYYAINLKYTYPFTFGK